MIRLSGTLMPVSHISRVVNYYMWAELKLQLGVADGHLHKKHTKYELGKIKNIFVSWIVFSGRGAKCAGNMSREQREREGKRVREQSRERESLGFGGLALLIPLGFDGLALLIHLGFDGLALLIPLRFDGLVLLFLLDLMA